ncbi:MAG: methionyl-tRNA formyltransferase [Alphaproteobacteria bacterium]
MRLAFFTTSLNALPLLEEAMRLCEIELWTRPSRKGKLSQIEDFAASRGVALHQPHNLNTSADILRTFDLALVFAYGLIFPKSALEAPRLGCVNLHPSLLPRWRGAAPVQATVVAGDAVSGFSWIRMREGVDTGPVLMQSKMTVGENETAPQLEARLITAATASLSSLLTELAAARIKEQPQNEAHATYAPRLTRNDGRLIWTQSAQELSQRVRGLQPWPGTYAILPDGGRLKVLAVNVAAPSAKAQQPGTRLIQSDREHGALLIACGEDGRDVLSLECVQRAGRAPCDAEAFLRGFEFPTRLPL